MKKYIAALFIFLFSMAVYAEDLSYQEISDEYGIIKASWSPFQLTFLPSKYLQLVSGRADIYGIAVGLLFMEQESATVSVAVTSGQHNNYGLQVAGVTMTNWNYGWAIGVLTSITEQNYHLQISCINLESEDSAAKKPRSKFSGLQIGVLNIGQGYQIGVINYNPKAFIPVLPIFNFSK